MNILILTNKLPYPPRDGGAIATLNMAAGLSASGHPVTLLALNTSKHYFDPGLIPSELRNSIHFLTIDIRTRIQWPALAWNLLFSGKPYNAVRFHSKRFLHTLKELLATEKYDIVQMEGPYLDYCLPLIRRMSQSRISFRAHNLEHEIWERRALQTKNIFKRSYLKLLSSRISKLEHSLADKVDMIIPISERDWNGFSGHSCPIFVCPAGLDLRSYPEPVAVDSIRLFFIGALDWSPNTEGLDWFFDNVWNRLSRLHPGIELHIAGRNPEYYSGDNRNLPGLVFKGEVPDAYDFMNHYSVMIVPLLSGSGIRVKILEGMLMGRTVITTSVGAEGLDVQNGTHLLIANTPDEFIRHIDLLIQTPAMVRDIGSAARQFVTENFDTLVIAKSLADFYSEQLT